MKQFFYGVGDERRGPVTEPALLNLFRLRTVTAETLLWSDGMPDWRPLAEIFPHWLSGAGFSADPVPPESENARCAVSGRFLRKADMIRFGDVYVSPENRDVYLQRLQQGLLTGPSDMTPADMWKRTGAAVLDVLLFAPLAFAGFVLGAYSLEDPQAVSDETASVIAVGWFLILMVYETVAVAAWGATLGKRLFGLEVVRMDGSRPGIGPALGRAVVKYVLGQCCSGLITLISIIQAIRNKPWHQSLHDQSAKTYVIERRR